MKAFVINLSRRKDRYDGFVKSHQKTGQDFSFDRFEAVDGSKYTYKSLLSEGFDTYKSWRDPYHNRKLTHGEIGCFLSHYKLFQKCVELNEPILIFEDDIRFQKQINIKRIEQLLQRCDLLYLCSKGVGKTPVQLDVDVVAPSYTYWTCAYAITPSGAKKLLADFGAKNIVPADEYFSLAFGVHPDKNLSDYFDPLPKIKALAMSPNLCSLSGGTSDIERPINSSARTNYFIDFKTHVYTVATDLKKADFLLSSCKEQKIPITVLGLDDSWDGGDMASGPGGGMKINFLKNSLKDIPNDDLVMFLDGYDVFVNEPLDMIVNRYLEFHSKVVFAAEKLLWPDKKLESQFPEAKGYKYLNSGCYIGVASELKKITQEPLSNRDDDQYYYQIKYLSNHFDIKLDSEGYIFQCVSGAEDFIEIRKNRQLNNKFTRCTGCICHGNGGSVAKEKFNELYLATLDP